MPKKKLSIEISLDPSKTTDRELFDHLNQAIETDCIEGWGLNRLPVRLFIEMAYVDFDGSGQTTPSRLEYFDFPDKQTAKAAKAMIESRIMSNYPAAAGRFNVYLENSKSLPFSEAKVEALLRAMTEHD